MFDEQETTKLAYERLPHHCVKALINYIYRGRSVGGFLTAVLRNDLFEACSSADDKNLPYVSNYSSFLYNYTPSNCWGNVDRVKAWMKMGGLEGQKKLEEQKKLEKKLEKVNE